MLRRRKNQRYARGGFTLVELLVVVLIITILATITLFALMNAGEAAKKARTRVQIAKIHDLLMPLWESYITRRVPISIPAGDSPTVAAAKRVDGMRELMRFEMPDRITDVTSGWDGSNYTPPTLATLPAHPALGAAYRRKATATRNFTGTDWLSSHQGSECLYLILSRLQDGDSNGLEHFRPDEFGDVDNDGMTEILDGWGKPIAFLRWAPGFLYPNSVLQKTSESDPIDPIGVRGNPADTYALYPLVFSAGLDQEYDIAVEASSGNLDYGNTTPKNNPFTMDGGQLMGEPLSGKDGWKDNVHNHRIDISIR